MEAVFPSNRGPLSNSASNGLVQTKFGYSSHAMTLIKLIQIGCYGRCSSLATGVSLVDGATIEPILTKFWYSSPVMVLIEVRSFDAVGCYDAIIP